MFNWEGFAALFEQNPYMAVIFLNKEGIITYTNASYLEVLAMPRDKVVGSHVLDITPHSRAYITLKTGKARVGYKWEVNNHQALGTALPVYQGQELVGVFAYTIFLNIWDGKNMLDDLVSDLNMYKDEVHRRHRAGYNFNDIIGEDAAITRVKQIACQVSRHPATTVLLIGESGTGKELFAHSIHNASSRCKAPFVRVNCAAIPENLLEAELFGYEEGAYTGARKGGKLGKFELADKGTIFLDEIGEMSFAMQGKLLVVLQEKVFERLGGERPIKVNVRVIAATNRDIENMVKKGEFREDLYYRLNVVKISLPPLRYRDQDILTISTHLIHKLCKKIHVHPRIISKSGIDMLLKYNWPGNVRELENVLERSLIIAEMEGALELTEKHFNLSMSRSSLLQKHNKEKQDLKSMLQEYEKYIISEMMAESDYNTGYVAQTLGIDISSLYRKLRKYKIKRRTMTGWCDQ